MNTADIERSVSTVLVAGLSGARIHKPGEKFEPAKAKKEWVKFSVPEFEPLKGLPGTEAASASLTVECYVKTKHKGGRAADVAALADSVRALVDGREGATADDLNNSAGSRVGRIRYGHADVSFSFAELLDVQGVVLDGVDVATVTVPLLVTSGTVAAPAA